FLTVAFDPRALYDPFSDRWLTSAATDSVIPTNSSVLIGVSRTSNPTNFSDPGWNLRQIKVDTNRAFWADYPTLGFNKDWVVLQANLVAIDTNEQRSHIYVF